MLKSLKKIRPTPGAFHVVRFLTTPTTEHCAMVHSFQTLAEDEHWMLLEYTLDYWYGIRVPLFKDIFMVHGFCCWKPMWLICLMAPDSVRYVCHYGCSPAWQLRQQSPWWRYCSFSTQVRCRFRVWFRTSSPNHWAAGTVSAAWPRGQIDINATSTCIRERDKNKRRALFTVLTATRLTHSVSSDERTVKEESLSS